MSWRYYLLRPGSQQTLHGLFVSAGPSRCTYDVYSPGIGAGEINEVYETELLSFVVGYKHTMESGLTWEVSLLAGPHIGGDDHILTNFDSSLDRREMVIGSPSLVFWIGYTF